MRTAAVFLLILSPAVPGQQALRTFSPAHIGGYFASLGDVDADGYEDLIGLTTLLNASGPGMHDYELRVYSGRDGSILRHSVYFPYPTAGTPHAAGDVDGDGTEDYALYQGFTLSCPCREISVRSGVDDRVLWRQQNTPQSNWGDRILGGIDLNGSGRPDLIVASPAHALWGAVWAYDESGNLLYQRLGSPTDLLAQSFAKLGDVDQDGCEDFVMGTGDPFWYGAADVVSGRTGQTIRRVFGRQQGDYIGSGVTGCGDLDGDGVPDFAAGGGLSGAYGSVQVFSTRTGQRLFAWYSGFVGDRFGSRLYAVDYDHDGMLDIVGPSDAGLRIISGREQTQIGFFVPALRFTATLEALPLRTPVLFPHFMVTGSWESWLVSAAPRDTEFLGHGCPGLLPRQPILGMRELQGRDRRVTLALAPPGSGALLLLGFAEGAGPPRDLAGFGLPGCVLHPDVAVLGFFVAGVAGLDAGYAHHDFRIPPAAAFGPGIDAQWAVLDPVRGLGGMSDAVRFAITPTH